MVPSFTLSARALSAVVIAGIAVAGPAAAQAPRPYVLDHGHIDLFDVVHDPVAGTPTLRVHDGTEVYLPASGPEDRDPADVVISIDSTETRFEIPDPVPAPLDRVGTAGDVIHLMPEPEPNFALPRIGWSSSHLLETLPPGVALATDQPPVRLEVEVDGPGAVFAWEVDIDGRPTAVWIDTVDPAPDVVELQADTHAHPVWVFTAEGEYTLSVTPSYVTSDGTTLTGTAEDYLIVVGERLVPWPTYRVEATLTGAEEPVTAGSSITISASLPEGEEASIYRWMLPTPDGEVAVVAESDQPTVTIEATTDTPIFLSIFGADGRIFGGGMAEIDVIE